MTACVDNNTKKGGAKKAVSATLAGVLAVGMVPAVALAADEAPEEEAGAELLAVSDATAWENGAVTAAVDKDGKAIADLDDIEFVAATDEDGNAVAQYVTPTEYTPDMGKATEVSTKDGDYSFTYYKAGTIVDGKVTAWDPITDESACTGVGTYAVAVTNTDLGATTDEDNYLQFSIVANSLEGATLYEVGDEANDVSDTTFEWDETAWTIGTAASANGKLGLALDGKPLDSKYIGSVVYYKDNIPVAGNAAPTAAGDYTVIITGADAYANSKVTINFTINALDLSKAKYELTMGNGFNTTPTIVKANGIDVTDKVSVKANQPMTDTAGSYSFTITPAKNVTDLAGTGVATAIKATYPNSEGLIKYDGEAVPSSYKVNHALEEAADGWTPEDLDLSLFKAKDGTTNIPLTITVKDEDGNVVDNSSVAKPGTWTVTVAIDSAACNYKYAGEVEVELEVIDGVIDADADVFIQYDGKLISGTDVKPMELTYDGNDLMKEVSVVVRVGDKTLEAGSDYTVEYLDGEGEAVTEMVNAGDYQIVVKSAGYKFDGDTEDTTFITINPVDVNKGADLKQVRIDPDTLVNYTSAENDYYAYTGENIVPALQYDTGKDTETYPVEDIFAELPADTYEISYQIWNEKSQEWEDVDAINAAGDYEVTIKDIEGDTPAAINWDIAEATIAVSVSDEPLFADVPVNEWYTEYVYDAAKAQAGGAEAYMSGYADTDLFGPNNNLLRGEAATILFRMAGGNTQNPQYDDFFGNASDIFGDVSATLFYNTPIAWAYQTGIITGYEDGTSEFRPNNSITREEFATMLYRYAQATNQVGDKTDADLTAYPDYASISTFAQEAIEWCVANDIMGGDIVLRPADTITRAEVAKMVTVFQPEALTPNF